MSASVLTAVAWPYANGPRHIGHVSGIGVPSDVFARYMRMSGHDVLMVSGSDEHGTPILVQADKEGLTPQQTADKYHRVVAEDMRALGVTYDLYTRTTTRNHYNVVQQIFLALNDNGYILPKTTTGAVSPSTGRTLPDRYIEGTCPICGYDGARGDQCDNCGNQLDAADLINPRSRINGEKPKFVETEHLFLDLPAFTRTLGEWLSSKTDWRPNVVNFTKNLVDDMRPRAITRDLDWGVPIPLDGWRDQGLKRFYVWFDAVIGYFSASVEWARRSGDPDAWKRFWNDPETPIVHFMGKDNITFHAQIWPALLMGHNGAGDKGGKPGPYGPLNLPTAGTQVLLDALIDGRKQLEDSGYRAQSCLVVNTDGYKALNRLVHGAIIADEKVKSVAKEHPDFAFYEGKKHTALYFARAVLPGVAFKAKLMQNEDRSALDISDAAFATV